MNIDLSALQGWKVHIGVAIAIAAVIATALLGVKIPGVQVDAGNWVNTVWDLLMISFGRSALAKVGVPTP